MDDVGMEHRLTTIEVTLRQGLSDIKQMGQANGDTARANGIILQSLNEKVGVQNGRMAKAEGRLIHVEELAAKYVPMVDDLVRMEANTNAVTKFIRTAGGIGNAAILLAISVFGGAIILIQLFTNH